MSLCLSYKVDVISILEITVRLWRGQITMHVSWLLSLSLSLPRCVFEADKAGCFRLERNGWFLLSGKWRVISLKSITAPATAASKSAGLSGNKGGIQVILFGLSLMQQGVWLEEFHLCVSVIVSSADAALVGSHRLSHDASPPVLSLFPSLLFGLICFFCSTFLWISVDRPVDNNQRKVASLAQA